MTPLEKAMMTHQPYVNPLDGVTEAFAQGVYEAPGQLAAVLDEFSPWAKLINAMSGKTLQQRTDAFTGANELGYSPEEYGASPLLQSMMRLGGNIVGDPLNAIPMGMVGKAGALKAADTLSDDMLTTPMRNQLGMITWQGSPHKYDGVLDPTKIGTGEGAQAYGYGHYLAESQDVANSYANGLARSLDRKISYGGREYDKDAIENLFDTDEKLGFQLLKYFEHNGDKNLALYDVLGDSLRREGIPLPEFSGNPTKTQLLLEMEKLIPQIKNPESLDMIRDIMDFADKKYSISDSGSNLYKFDLDDNAIANMLDWDAPLSEQHRVMQGLKSLSNMGDSFANDILNYDLVDEPNLLAKHFYDKLNYKYGEDQAKSSEYLRSIGIPGIKYFDGSSRSAGEGTRNFVVFPGNENLVTPLERNGEPLGILPKR